MPLFIDLHVDSSLTPELVNKCHVADKAIQEKYGVKYLQVLLNQPQGHLFCLAEGPDKESVIKVHQEAHGAIACNVLEITQSDFIALLDKTQKNSLDYTTHEDGTIDTGNRIILSMNVLGTSQFKVKVNDISTPIFTKFHGRMSESLQQDVVFTNCTEALQSAHAILSEIQQSGNFTGELRFGISVGSPLTKDGSFFEDGRTLACQFAFISNPGCITLSAKARQLFKGDLSLIDSETQVVDPSDEKFLSKVFECLRENWSNSQITMDYFSQTANMSKSQLTRRLKKVSPLSPNDFLREFRLRKSIDLLNEGLNVAEVTMAIGFTNPSYFTKCFRDRFGLSPSEYLTAN